MATMPANPVTTTLDRLLGELGEADARISRAAQGLDAERLRWRPPEGGWGIGDVLEHLVASNEAYLARLRELVRDAGGGAIHAAVPQRGFADWRPSLMGGFLARSMRAPRKLPAPKVWRPAAEPGADALERFLAGEREMADLLRASAALDWRRTRLSSPVSRLIRLNLGDVFEITAAHVARHAGQIERVRGHRDFPTA